MTKRTERPDTTAFTVVVHLTDAETRSLLDAARSDTDDPILDDVIAQLGVQLIEQLVEREERIHDALERELVASMRRAGVDVDAMIAEHRRRHPDEVEEAR